MKSVILFPGSKFEGSFISINALQIQLCKVLNKIFIYKIDPSVRTDNNFGLINI